LVRGRQKNMGRRKEGEKEGGDGGDLGFELLPSSNGGGRGEIEMISIC
jgi:hypothetical protein